MWPVTIMCILGNFHPPCLARALWRLFPSFTPIRSSFLVIEHRVLALINHRLFLFADDGISIPCEYTSFLAPVSAPKLHYEVSQSNADTSKGPLVSYYYSVQTALSSVEPSQSNYTTLSLHAHSIRKKEELLAV